MNVIRQICKISELKLINNGVFITEEGLYKVISYDPGLITDSSSKPFFSLIILLFAAFLSSYL